METLKVPLGANGALVEVLSRRLSLRPVAVQPEDHMSVEHTPNLCVIQ